MQSSYILDMKNQEIIINGVDVTSFISSGAVVFPDMQDVFKTDIGVTGDRQHVTIPQEDLSFTLNYLVSAPEAFELYNQITQQYHGQTSIKKYQVSFRIPPEIQIIANDCILYGMPPAYFKSTATDDPTTELKFYATTFNVPRGFPSDISGGIIGDPIRSISTIIFDKIPNIL